MKNEIFAGAQHSVYPGLYTPVREKQSSFDKINLEPCPATPDGLCSMIKKQDHVIIEIQLTGYDRQDIFIAGYDNLLSVIVLHESMTNAENSSPAAPDHHQQNYHRNFLLPGNADGELGCANYKDGYLSIYIPTGTPLPYRPKAYCIVVY